MQKNSDLDKSLIDSLIEQILSTSATRPTYFVQIGAGAGDRDPRSFRDGFSEFIKRAPLNDSSRILLVEPNPLNQKKLKECWQDFSNAEIFQLGIVPKAFSKRTLRFYFTGLDGPHYQVASFNRFHVLKHFPNLKESDLQTINVGTIDLKTFIEQETKGEKIVLLALDIEGIDAEVLLDTDFDSLNVQLLSFEHLHLGGKKTDVIKHSEECGFEYVGSGVDHNDYDLLFQRIPT